MGREIATNLSLMTPRTRRIAVTSVLVVLVVLVVLGALVR